MKIPKFNPEWPESWKMSFEYDQLEVVPGSNLLGYRYAYQLRKRAIFQALAQIGIKQGRVLDVAAAQGNFSLSLAESGFEVTWNDLRAELADYVNLKYERGSISYLPGDIFSINPSQSFDLILAAEVIEHVAHPDKMLSRLAELVTPGGHIVISTPNGEYIGNHCPRFSECPDPSQYEKMQFKPNSDGHIFLLWPEELRELASKVGLQIVYQSFFSTPLTSGHFGFRFILPILPRGVVYGADLVVQSLSATFLRQLLSGMVMAFKRVS